MRRRVGIVNAALLLAACSSSPPQPAGPLGQCAGGDAGYVVGSGDAGAAHPANAVCSAAGECEEQITITSALHFACAIDYPDPPPTGGNHNPCWGAWGVHDTPLPAKNWVHNLEHGGVVLLYNCPDGCKADVAAMSDFVRAHPRTVLTEYSAMHARFAAVAWGYRLLMAKKLDLDAIGSFYLQHFDQAPESIDAPPPSGC
jgi:hypothetical protein